MQCAIHVYCSESDKWPLKWRGIKWTKKKNKTWTRYMWLNGRKLSISNEFDVEASAASVLMSLPCRHSTLPHYSHHCFTTQRTHSAYMPTHTHTHTHRFHTCWLTRPQRLTGINYCWPHAHFVLFFFSYSRVVPLSYLGHKYALRITRTRDNSTHAYTHTHTHKHTHTRAVRLFNEMKNGHYGKKPRRLYKSACSQITNYMMLIAV